MGALHTTDNGTTILLPYAMPRSIDECGEEESQGRYCVAYSRDGWWVIDADKGAVVCWAASEEDAIAQQWAQVKS